MVTQGGIVVARVSGSQVATATARWLARDYPLYKEAEVLWMVLPVAPDQEPGDYPLEVRLIGGDGAPLGALATTIAVKDGGFPVRDVELAPGTVSLFTPENVAEERAKAGAAYSLRTPERLWRGTFLVQIGRAHV